MSGNGKYYDGKRPFSVPVTWEYRDDMVILSIIETDTRLPSWPVKNLILDADQLSAAVILNIQTGEKLEIDGRLDGLPTSLLKKSKVSSNPKHLVGLLFILALLLVGFWIALPILSSTVAKMIPENTEREWSEKFKIDEIKEIKVCNPGPKAILAWDKVVSRIYPLYPTDRSVTVSFKIVKTDLENAFTLPGGKILIASKLVKNASTPEELAGVVAHEIGHVKERHVMQKLISALSMAAVFHFIGGDFSSAFALDPTTILSFASLSFDRGMEMKADELTKKRLIDAKVNPRDMANFFERSALNPDKYSIFTTHPGDEERTIFFRDLKKENKYKSILSSEEWKDLKGYCL